jgi:RNA-directed DNA polymerase
MKEPYVEGVADHDDPESCVVTREGAGEALTGALASWVLSSEKLKLQGADAVETSGKQHGVHRHGEVHAGPARSETPCVSGNHLHGNREISGPPEGDAPGPQREGVCRTPLMHGPEKSDLSIVPEKRPNKFGQPSAEAVEGRGGAEGTADRQSTRRTQSRESVLQASFCVRDVVGISGIWSNTRGGSRVR